MRLPFFRFADRPHVRLIDDVLIKKVNRGRAVLLEVGNILVSILTDYVTCNAISKAKNYGNLIH
jgi:hypothetical protein